MAARSQIGETDMEFVYTSGKNKDFIGLCMLLDEYLDEAVGGEKQKTQYSRYNGLEEIHDVVLFYENGQPIACAAYKYYEEGTAEVKRVFVRKEFRGRKISILLMEKLEEKAKEQGYKRLILETGRVLLQAISLYKKIGYTIIDNFGQYKALRESVCMCKWL